MNRELRCIALVALGFIALGLWQHLYFSYSVHSFAAFKNAYDEDTYLLFPFGPNGVQPYRLLSGTAVSALLWLSRGSGNFVLMALDGILPPLVFLAAHFAGAAIYRSFPARLLFALVVVFSSDLFSLGSSAAYPGPFPTLAHFKMLVGGAMVPPIETSYLTLFRSPEPQVGYIVAFLFVGILLRMVLRNDDEMRRRELTALVAVQFLLVFSYALISYPLFLIEGFATAVLLYQKRRRIAATIGIIFAASIVIAFFAARLTLGPSSTFLFASRLPVVTVGVIFALVLTAIFMIALWRHGLSDSRLLLGLGFSGMPLVLTNQQVLTGVMISARDWERSIDLPLVIIAAGLLISFAHHRLAWFKALALPAAAIVAVFVITSSVRTYDIWLPGNVRSLAIARAVEAASPKLDRNTLLVLDQPDYAPLVEIRLGRPLNSLLTYTDVFKKPIPVTPAFTMTSLANSLFEYWRQTGVTPDKAKGILDEEARARAGFYSGFLFNVCEYWYPCTDGRNVKTEKVAAQIPAIIEAYRNFLTEPESLQKFAFVVSNMQAVPENKLVIGQGRVGQETATVLLRN